MKNNKKKTYFLICHFSSGWSPNLASTHLSVIEPGLSIGKPNALAHTKFAIHPRALETAKQTV